MPRYRQNYQGQPMRKRCFKLSPALVLTSVLMMFAHISFAAQTKFEHFAGGSEQQFSYSWKNQDASYHLQFAIPSQAFYQMPSTQPAFSNVLMQRDIEVALLEYAQTLDPRTARITVDKRPNKIEYGVVSSSPKVGKATMQRLKSISAKARKTYLDKHFYEDYQSRSGQKAIKHDHQKYAQLSYEHLSPIVSAIKSMQRNANDPREFIQLALAWVQSIPYSTLKNRASSNGAGFVSPKDLLTQNQGDCDSKATFLAALLRAYSGGAIRQTMILLPNHALLGIAIGARDNERSIRFQGVEYVLLEAAGPGYFKIGETTDKTLRGLRNRQYSVEPM